jgi:hypothetical protein
MPQENQNPKRDTPEIGNHSNINFSSGEKATYKPNSKSEKKPEEEIKGVRDIGEEWKAINLLDVFLRDIRRTVAPEDSVFAILCFLTMLSAYTKNPINLYAKAPSSSGKSYVPNQVKKYFPEEDVLVFSISPRALIHLQGVKKTADGRLLSEIEIPKKPKKPKRERFKSDEEYQLALAGYRQKLEEYKQKKEEYEQALAESYIEIDLRGKTLVITDIEDPKMLKAIRPLLSHDQWQTTYLITDRSVTGQLRTKKVVFIGWPAFIFTGVDKKYEDEIATRCLTVSPALWKKKIENAVKISFSRKSIIGWGKDTKETELIRRIVGYIKPMASDYETKLPFLGLEKVFPTEEGRNMRDANQFLGLIDAVTLLFSPNRVKANLEGEKCIFSNADDINTAYWLLQQIWEITQTNTEESALRFFWNCFPKDRPVTAKELLEDSKFIEKYRKVFNRKKPPAERTLWNWLERLNELGYVISEPDPSDKRRKIFKAVIKSSEEVVSLSKEIFRNSFLKKALEEWLEAHKGRIPREHFEELKEALYLNMGNGIVQISEEIPKEEVEEETKEEETSENTMRCTNSEEKEIKEEELKIPKLLSQYVKIENREGKIQFTCTVKVNGRECGFISADPNSIIAHLKIRHGISLE